MTVRDILGTVVLAGVNAEGEPGFISGTYIIAGIDADGVAHVIRVDSSGNIISGTTIPYALLRDEKAQNTAGGTFTSGAWQTRDLNTEVIDTDDLVSLAANRFTLQPGTWWISARVPGKQVDSHQARLQNITDGTTTLIGTSEQCASGQDIGTSSLIVGRFTITSAKEFEIQHRCQTTRSTDGFGEEANFTTEVYTVVELRRESAS